MIPVPGKYYQLKKVELSSPPITVRTTAPRPRRPYSMCNASPLLYPSLPLPIPPYPFLPRPTPYFPFLSFLTSFCPFFLLLTPSYYPLLVTPSCPFLHVLTPPYPFLTLIPCFYLPSYPFLPLPTSSYPFPPLISPSYPITASSHSFLSLSTLSYSVRFC